jgi:excisionase family DNA binding protein
VNVEEDDKLRTVAFAMDKLGVSRAKIYRLVKESRLEAVKFDTRTRITDRSLRKLMADIMEGKAS